MTDLETTEVVNTESAINNEVTPKTDPEIGEVATKSTPEMGGIVTIDAPKTHEVDATNIVVTDEKIAEGVQLSGQEQAGDVI